MVLRKFYYEHKSSERSFTMHEWSPWYAVPFTLLSNSLPGIPKMLSPRKLAFHMREDGAAAVGTLYYPRKKEYSINLIVFDLSIQNTESLRRVKAMIAAAEAHARELGAKRISTDYTILTPRTVQSLLASPCRKNAVPSTSTRSS